MHTVTSRSHLTPPNIWAALKILIAALHGNGADPTGLMEGFKLRLGVGMLSLQYQAFLTKAKGGTDEAGITWAKLSMKYIAYGRRHPGLNGLRKQAAAEGRKGRPLLSKGQDTLWRQVYARMFWKFKNAGEGNASGGHAAAVAWQIVKAAGGKTIIGEYGNTPVEIGRDTGRMLNAMAPGLEGTGDQVIRSEPGAVVAGIRIKYAAYFHAKRPLWDFSRPLPQTWKQQMDFFVSSFFEQAIPRLLT